MKIILQSEDTALNSKCNDHFLSYFLSYSSTINEKNSFLYLVNNISLDRT